MEGTRPHNNMKGTRPLRGLP